MPPNEKTIAQRLSFSDMTFDTNLVSAFSHTKGEIKFSKYERALLSFFVAHPGQLVTRAKLLDCLQTLGSETLDRNIDYLISRLRRKLGDSAKNPKFIATQYGEGYLWVGKSSLETKGQIEQTYLAIGPIYGIDRAHLMYDEAGQFVTLLTAALKKELGPQRKIRLLTTDDYERNFKEEEEQPQTVYSLALSFLALHGSFTCSLVVLCRTSGQVFGSFRHNLEVTRHDNESAAISSLAQKIKERIWFKQIFRIDDQSALNSDPLTVGVYKASKLFYPFTDKFNEVESILRERLSENPENHHAAIMLVSVMHTRSVDRAILNADWKHEAESLIIDHLSGIQNDALYLASAAERLHDFGHYELAEQLAMRALSIGPAFAACYMVIGRIKVHQGLIQEGLTYYQHSLELSEKDSLFFIMLNTMMAIAFKALGNQMKFQKIMAYVTAMEEDKVRKISLEIFSFAGDQSSFKREVAVRAKSLTKEAARHFLKQFYTLAAELFHQEIHRRNILIDVVKFYTDIHSNDVVPDIITQSTPSVLLK